MYVNRGMIEKARNEGEVAGVMAHEISHVALRHGTAQQTKATPFAIGQIAGQIAGAIIGGTRGAGDRAGLAVRARHLLPEVRPRVREAVGPSRRAHHGRGRLRPARHGERVPDDRAGRRIRRAAVAELAPGSGQPLRVHQPGSASAARRSRRPAIPREFQNVQAHLRSMSPAPSAEDVARNSNAPAGPRAAAVGSRVP